MKNIIPRLLIASLIHLQPVFALETTIRGGTMELKNQGERVFFSGGVELNRGDDTLTARQMETNKSRDQVTAKGAVQFFRVLSATETLKGFGKKGYYETRIGSGWLEDPDATAHAIYAQVLSSTITRIIDIYANRFDFDKSKSVVVATGRVYGKSIDPETKDIYEFWADKADYLGDQNKIVLSGSTQPKVRQVNLKVERLIHGDTITYFYETKKFLSEGNAKAYLTDKEEDTTP